MIKLEIRIKPDSREDKSTKLYNLLRSGLKGKYVLSTVTEDKNKGEFTFVFKEKS